MGEFGHIVSDGAKVQTYFSLPEKPNGHGIVLASAVWGLSPDLRNVADGYAALGYAVIAPNVFWRQKPDHAMDYDFTHIGMVSALADNGKDEDAFRDIRAAKAELVRRTGCTRVAGIGWCYGGRIVCRMSTEDVFDFCAGMYPTWMEMHVDIAPKVKTPMHFHLPENERYGKVPDALERMLHTFGKHPMVETFLYKGVEHGFDFAPPHPHGNHAAARLCDQRVLLALDRVLVRGETLK